MARAPSSTQTRQERQGRADGPTAARQVGALREVRSFLDFLGHMTFLGQSITGLRDRRRFATDRCGPGTTHAKVAMVSSLCCLVYDGSLRAKG